MGPSRCTGMRARAVYLLLAMASLAACGSAPVPARAAAFVPASVAPSPTRSAPATVRPTGPRWPLTGLVATGPITAPALSVKVDNAPAARPQRGLNSADLVVEAPVEGGMSRFLAVFHSQATTVGPIRSARPVDGALLRALNGGLFAYSGAAAGEIAPVHAYSGSFLLSRDADPRPFFVDNSRPAPDNVFASTTTLRAEAQRLGAREPAPPPLFHYGPVSAGSTLARRVDLILGSGSTASWTYDGSRYLRAEQGSPHLLADGQTVSATNIVLMVVGVAHSGITDANHVEDPFVLAYGQGTAVVVRNGVAETGTWTRPSISDPFSFRGATGAPLPLAPGRTWIELVPNAQSTIPAGSFRLS